MPFQNIVVGLFDILKLNALSTLYEPNITTNIIITRLIILFDGDQFSFCSAAFLSLFLGCCQRGQFGVEKTKLFYAQEYPVTESTDVYNYFGINPYRLLDVVLDNCI